MMQAIVSIARLLQLSAPHSSPLPGFHQVCLLFYKKYYINLILLWSDYCKIWCILKKKQFISFNFWSDVILLFYVYVFLRCFHFSAIMKLWIASYLHTCIAAYLLYHQIMWHNKNSWSWFENSMLLFFWFTGKLTSGLILPP